MTFLQPYLLWGLPLVLVPVIIHFLNRMRYRNLPWAAMMFVLAASRQSVRNAKLREILLLACRVLAVLFLVLLLARPLAGDWLGWAFRATPDTVVLLLDRSPSMDAQQKRATALRRFVEAAKPLEGRTRFVILDSATRKPAEIGSLSLLEELPQTQAADSSANLPALLQAAVDYTAANPSGRTEFWIASDLQTSDWQPDNTARWATLTARISALPQDIQVRLLAARQPATENNITVSVAEARRRKIGSKTELVLNIDLRQTVATPRELPVTIVFEGARSVVNVNLNTAQLRFQHKLDLGNRTTRGWGWVEIPADANPRDNTAYFVFDGERHLESIVAATDTTAGRVLALAAAPLPEALNQSSRLILPAELQPRDYKDTALVILQGVDPGKVRPYLENGGIVVSFPGGNDGEETSVPITHWRGNEGPLAAGDEGEELPVREITVQRRVTQQTGTVLAKFQDGVPFLTRENVGKGLLYTCATAPERKWSSLAEGSVLVPMIQRLVRDGGRRLGTIGTESCGREPFGDARRLDKERGGGAEHAGIYQRGAELVARNRPLEEDEAEFAELDSIKALFGTVPVRVFEETGSTGKLAGEIWQWFAWLMLLALVAEAALTFTKRPAQPVTTGRGKAATEPAEAKA